MRATEAREMARLLKDEPQRQSGWRKCGGSAHGMQFGGRRLKERFEIHERRIGELEGTLL